MASQVNFTKSLQKSFIHKWRDNTYTAQTLQKIAGKGKLQNSFYKTTTTMLTPKPDKDTTYTHKKKASITKASIIDAKILNKIIANRIQQHLKKIIYKKIK